MFVQNHRTPNQAKHHKLSHLTEPRPAPVNKKLTPREADAKQKLKH